MASDDAELIRAHTAKRGAIYREPSFRTITLRSWREIVEVAYEEALLGDDRARVWIQRTIGLADAARIERAVRAVASHVSFTDMLDAAAAQRAQTAHGGTRPDPAPQRERAVKEPDEENYWSVVFDVVTPAAWERLVETSWGYRRSFFSLRSRFPANLSRAACAQGLSPARSTKARQWGSASSRRPNSSSVRAR